MIELFADIENNIKKTIYIGSSDIYFHWIKVDRVTKDFITLSHIYNTEDNPKTYIMMNVFRHKYTVPIHVIVDDVRNSIKGYINNSDGELHPPEKYSFGVKVK